LSRAADAQRALAGAMRESRAFLLERIKAIEEKARSLPASFQSSADVKDEEGDLMVSVLLCAHAGKNDKGLYFSRPAYPGSNYALAQLLDDDAAPDDEILGLGDALTTIEAEVDQALEDTGEDNG
jgi:hypothetical protein